MSIGEKLQKADTTLEMYLHWDMRIHLLFLVSLFSHTSFNMILLCNHHTGRVTYLILFLT